MQLFIRQIIPADVQEVTNLSHQLGYPLTIDQIRQNINAILVSNDHNAYVTVQNDHVVGWIGLCHSIQLELPPYCEINGLVVDENCRGLGIGKMLIEKAKQWAREKGDDKIRLRCNVKRTEAHMFYQHLGFVETKEQKNFEVDISV